MADQTVLNPGTGGDTIRTIDRTSDSTPIAAKTQVMQIDVGGESNESLLVGTTQGVQPTVLIGTQSAKDSGRTYVVFYIDAIATVSTEALATFTANVGGTTSSGTTYTVPAGQTLRIQSMCATVKSSATAVAGGRIRLRVSSGTVASTSPIVIALDVPAPAATSIGVEGGHQEVFIPDGLELAQSTEIGISQIASTTSATLSVCVQGFYY